MNKEWYIVTIRQEGYNKSGLFSCSSTRYTEQLSEEDKTALKLKFADVLFEKIQVLS